MNGQSMSSEIIYYAIIVLYNKSVTDSQTINNLKGISGYNIKKIILDNSTIPNDNAELCRQQGIIYLDMEGNVGLSKAYNKALDYLTDSTGVVIWFDDDTDVTKEYFITLNNAIINNPDVSIFTPLIRGQDGKFWSPNSVGVLKNKQLKNRYEKIYNNKFNAINSCTAVRLDIYKNYRYNESLFLDQVDHNFFYDMRKKGINCMKIDVIINHNFSLKNKHTSIENIKKRYKIMVPDFLMYSNKSKRMFLIGKIKVIGWGVREAIKYKNFSFILWIIKEMNSALANIRRIER